MNRLTFSRHGSEIPYARAEPSHGQHHDLSDSHWSRQSPQIRPPDPVLDPQVSEHRIRPYARSSPFHYAYGSARVRFRGDIG